MEKSEFDRFADEYYAEHAKGLRASGESPEFFYEYKVRAIAETLRARGRSALRILDFGSGVGNSVPYFRKHIPAAALTCADVSRRSLAVGDARFPGATRSVEIDGERLPFDDGQFDLVFSACVFHHISHAEHVHWLRELRRVASTSATLSIFEHNPWNPLTAKVVRECPFDEHAVLIAGPDFKRTVASSGWSTPEIHYKVFFPRALAFLRPAEKWLSRVPLGAQYMALATAS
jgi:ubiquinone/menaquinone biosynthesis C-methylase UbiE